MLRSSSHLEDSVPQAADFKTFLAIVNFTKIKTMASLLT